nr:dephospho-CoA kinase [Gemmatimonadota bacterium]
LNRIVHPPLMALLRERLREARSGKSRLVVVDAALIFELGVLDLFDRIVLVTAPAQTRIERLRRRSVDASAVEGLLASQQPDEEKRALAHCVLVNDASRDALEAAALACLDGLRALERDRNEQPGPVSSPTPAGER